jgi:hypothetical protein
MTVFRLLAAVMVSILIVEIIVFNFWIYLTSKSTELLNKYWLNNFNPKDNKGLTKSQAVLLKAISMTQITTVIFLGLHIFALMIR